MQHAPLGVYVYLRVLKAMWNKAKQWGYVTSNPFEQIKLKKRQSEGPVSVTERMLIQIVKCITIEIVRDVVLFAFYTGLRLGETTNLILQNVNLQEGILTIGSENSPTKSRRQRTVPIHPKAKEILIKRLPKDLKNENQYVFSKSNGYAYTGDYFSRRFKQACRKAGIDEKVTFHSLRHGTITRMASKGAPLPAVQRVAGHSSIQTTMLYTHPDIDALRKAVEKL
jgi:integrase